jgi:hypothetical protein
LAAQVVKQSSSDWPARLAKMRAKLMETPLLEISISMRKRTPLMVRRVLGVEGTAAPEVVVETPEEVREAEPVERVELPVPPVTLAEPVGRAVVELFPAPPVTPAERVALVVELPEPPEGRATPVEEVPALVVPLKTAEVVVLEALSWTRAKSVPGESAAVAVSTLE